MKLTAFIKMESTTKPTLEAEFITDALCLDVLQTGKEHTSRLSFNLVRRHSKFRMDSKEDMRKSSWRTAQT